MSYINNDNPRRMIWFNQNAPKNKMDLWLSYNRHYEDTSDNETTDPQETVDNSSQRHCDLILKAWDCGQWVPIVGFNTTAANKIDTVTGVDYTIDGVTHSGKEVYHPAIFTDESPNELYDAGTLGSLLNNLNFVSEQEWYDVFNSTDYNWSNIFGDTNWFGNLTWSIIQDGSSIYQLPRAQSNRLGGVWADTFATVAANGFAQCKFKGSSDSNLYVSGSDIIGAINDYYISGGTTPIDIQLANTERIGGIKAAQDPQDADDCRNIPIVLAGPTVGSVWGLPFGSGTYPGDTDNETEYLYLPGWALREWLKNPYTGSGDPTPIIASWKGVDVQLRNGSDQVWVGLSGLIPEYAGKIPQATLDVTDPSGVNIQWIDLPSGTTYSTLASGSSSGTTYVVKGGSDDKHFLNGNGEWVVPQSSGSYTGTNLIEVSGSTIGIDVTTNVPSSGDVISYVDNTVKWVTPQGGNNYTAGVGINIPTGTTVINANILEKEASPHQSGETFIRIVDNPSGQVVVHNVTSNDMGMTILNSYEYTEVETDASKFVVALKNKNTNPIYIKLNHQSPMSVEASGGTIEYVQTDWDFVASGIPSGYTLVTVQFGAVKIEPIKTLS